MDNTVAFILGGGKGSRLMPLTSTRSKPAVPIGGKYRIIDIPVSNCINSDIKKIFVVTQFNSKSLNHHINHAYRFDIFGGQFVDILAAEQTNESIDWFQGTADAVRRNLRYIEDYKKCDTVLILSGDQLYRMDFRVLYETHKKENADMTIATLPVSADKVPGFGVMKIEKRDGFSRVADFIEKPKDSKVIRNFETPAEILKSAGFHDSKRRHLASMGIYMFKREVLIEALSGTETDFGQHIIPRLIRNKQVAPYVYDGYWEDIGTIKSFHQANLDLVGEDPEFKLYTPDSPLYTNARFLPPAFVQGADIAKAMIGDGAVVLGGQIHNSIVGLRGVIQNNVVLKNVVMLGADYYDRIDERSGAVKGMIPLGIGEGSVVRDAIIDKNARIGKNVRLENRRKLLEYSDPSHGLYIRDGIIVVEKDGVIPDGLVL